MKTITILILALTLALASCGIEDTQLAATSTAPPATEPGEPATTTTEAAPEAGFLKLGDTVAGGGLDFTPTAVEIRQLDDLGDNAPGGAHRVVITASASSTSGEAEEMSSFLNFEARTADGTPLEQDIWTGMFDATVAPGVPLAGQLAYFVPEGVESFLLLVSLDFLGDPAIYEIPVPTPNP